MSEFGGGLEAHLSPVRSRTRLAFGPETHWASWDWIVEPLRPHLQRWYEISTWGDAPPREADVIVCLKFLPDNNELAAVSERAKVIYCPVDIYGTSHEIDADACRLLECARIVVHNHRLPRYFAPYGPVSCLDHQVRFVNARPMRPRPNGPILFVGIRGNLPPLVEWVGKHPLPAPLLILTDADEAGHVPTPVQLGLDPQSTSVERWTSEIHLKRISEARAAIDIKGSDFRARHKPAAKAVDFIAAGLPLAMNADASAVEYLADWGFEVADPRDVERWLSASYRDETVRLGAALRELLSVERIAWRFRQIVEAARVEPRRAYVT